MNIHEFYQKKAIGFIIVVVIFTIGYFIFNQTSRNNKTQNGVITNGEVENIAPIGKPVFTWDLNYGDAGEYPETVLNLSAKYENDVVITKKIDTAQGSCNTYDNRDKDVYIQSEMIICYFAGLGHYYKIIESEGNYKVQRKIFEEASPEYNPPVLPFETIVEF